MLSSPGGAGFILEPQPISNLSVGLGFPHSAGLFRPGGSPFSSPDCQGFRYVVGFMNRGWGSMLPGCGEMVGFPRGATPAARALIPDWPRASGGGALGQRDLGSENAGMNVFCLLYCIVPSML